MIIKFNFLRYGETVSRYVHLVLKVILKIYSLLLSRLVPVLNNSTNSRWKWFKGCLGALNGTYISGQKGRNLTNVLVMCDSDMKFVYILPGLEGSTNGAHNLLNLPIAKSIST
ncbi:hypothetical protein ACS0TY_027989 [Phlomoides rotata]